jgi:hypothetical protein
MAGLYVPFWIIPPELEPALSRFSSFRTAADLACGAHGLERARDDLRRASAVRIVNGFGLEQLRVGQDDPQLVVQAVKKLAEVGVHLGGTNALAHSGNVYIHAWCPAETEFPGF